MEHMLRVDATTVRVVSALDADGIEPILLKGRAFARELYDSPLERPFGDADLLVRASQFERSEAVLASLGYRRATPGLEETYPPWTRHAHNWVHPPPATAVELHWSVVGTAIEGDALVDRLEPYLTRIDIGPKAVATLAGSGTAWMAALHAAQHGDEEQTLRDLERALAVFGRSEWSRAASLAQELDSLDAFAAGLRLRPRGAEVLRELNIDAAGHLTIDMLASNAPPGALAFEELTGGSLSTKGKLRMVAGTLAPGPAALRALDPLARRGAVGLAAGYLLHPLRLAAKTPSAWLAWRRARRRHGWVADE